MKKLTTLISTTLVTLVLFLAAPSAMADPDPLDEHGGNIFPALCLVFLRFDILDPLGFDSVGDCVVTLRTS